MLKKSLQPGSEFAAPAYLRDLDDLDEERCNAVGIFVFPDRTANDQRQRGESGLRDVGCGVKSRRSCCGRHGNAELRPKPPAAVLQVRERFAVDGIKQDDLSCGRQNNPAWIDGAVRKAPAGVQTAKGWKNVEKKSERDIDAGHGPFLRDGVQQLGKPGSRDEFRQDDNAAIESAFNRPRFLQPLVVEGEDPFEAFAQTPLERRQLRPDDEAFEHRAVFAVEGEGAPP
jgi:hypothetical protein